VMFRVEIGINERTKALKVRNDIALVDKITKKSRKLKIRRSRQ